MTLKNRPVIFGEVLFDKFPDGARVLGGAPFNVSWHLQAFGAGPLLVSGIGQDPEGQEIRGAMESWGMETSGLHLDPDWPTGAVQVSLKNGQPSYDIVDQQAYDRVPAPPALGGEIGLVYHGSLALRNPGSRAGLAALKEMAGAPVFVDVNLRAPWWTLEGIRALATGARWIKLNDEELDLLEPDPGSQAEKARRLLARDGVAAVFLTKGGSGAEAFAADGTHARVAPAPALSIVDTVGAGDAFASVLVLGLLSGWDLQTVLDRAQHFASALVGVRGATVQDSEFYTPYLQDWGMA